MLTPIQQISHNPIDGSVAGVFKNLAGNGSTGVLEVAHGPVKRSLWLRQGSAVFATSTDREDRLNGVLLRLGLVTLPDLALAVQQMVRENRRLGEVLVEEKLLDGERLAGALRIQVREIICHALSIAGGKPAFTSKQVPDHADAGLQIHVNILIREALFRTSGVNRVLEAIGGLSSTYQLTDRAEHEIASAGLNSRLAAVVPLFRKPVGLDQVCSTSPLNDFDICRLVWVLLTIRALVHVD